MKSVEFEWDPKKNQANIMKHGVSFGRAEQAFYDENRIIARDTDHSTKTQTRYYCFGKVAAGILTVRFTVRGNGIRIFGAGYWRKGKQVYEKRD